MTAGGLDTHIHFISPTQVETALYSGVTTMIGGGTGPADGTNATTCTPGRFNIEKCWRQQRSFRLILDFLEKEILPIWIQSQNRSKQEPAV